MKCMNAFYLFKVIFLGTVIAVVFFLLVVLGVILCIVFWTTVRRMGQS